MIIKTNFFEFGLQLQTDKKITTENKKFFSSFIPYHRRCIKNKQSHYFMINKQKGSLFPTKHIKKEEKENQRNDTK